MKVLAVSFDEYRDNEQRIRECGVEGGVWWGEGAKLAKDVVVETIRGLYNK